MQKPSLRSLILCNYYFPLQISPRLFFLSGLFSPVHFFDTLRLIIPLPPPCTIIILFGLLFHIQELVSQIKRVHTN